MTDFTKVITDKVPMSAFDCGLAEEVFEEVKGKAGLRLRFFLQIHRIVRKKS